MAICRPLPQGFLLQEEDSCVDRQKWGLCSCPDYNFLYFPLFHTCSLDSSDLVTSTKDGGVDVQEAGGDHGKVEVEDTLLEMLVTSLKNAL